MKFASATALVALFLTACASAPWRSYSHTEGAYTLKVSYPSPVSGPQLPVDVTLTNGGRPTVTHPMPEQDVGCGLNIVTLKNAVTGAQVRPQPEQKSNGCHTDGLILHLEAGQTVHHRYWYSVRGVATGVYTLPLSLPPEFGTQEIEVEVKP